MTRSFLIAGIVLSVIAILLGIAALGTTNWMKKMFYLRASAMLPIFLLKTKAVGEKFEACIKTIPKRDYQPMHGYQRANAWDMFVEATAGLMIAGLLLLIVGIVFLSLSACSRSVSTQRKVSAGAYGRIGVGIIIASTILYGIGVGVYTIEQGKTVHNPQQFLMQIAGAMQKMYQKMGMAGGANGMGSLYDSNYGRKRRQIDSTIMTPINKLPELSDSDWSNFNFNSKTDLSSNDLSPVHDSRIPDVSNENSVENVQQMLQEIAKNFDPVFGYSFYIAWAGFLFALMAAIVSVLSCRRQNPYADDLHPVL